MPDPEFDDTIPGTPEAIRTLRDVKSDLLKVLARLEAAQASLDRIERYGRETRARVDRNAADIAAGATAHRFLERRVDVLGRKAVGK